MPARPARTNRRYARVLAWINASMPTKPVPGKTSESPEVAQQVTAGLCHHVSAAHAFIVPQTRDKPSDKKPAMDDTGGRRHASVPPVRPGGGGVLPQALFRGPRTGG